jgi:hypothetical protein
MFITDALTAHHQVLRQLYQESLNDPAKFAEFTRHLIVHHTMEEKYFYNLMANVNETRHDSLEAVNEHHIIELIIKDAEGFPEEHENFPIKIEGLGEYTSHHLDEEEAEVFPALRPHLTDDEADTLGNLFNEVKEKLLAYNPPEAPKGIPGGNAGKGGGASRGLGIGSLK